MAFHEVQFPTDISYGSSGGPSYSTDIVITAGGHEQRNINWAAAQARYNVAHGVKTQGQLEALIAFFRARRGRAYGFRFKDWSDYEAVGQVLGNGDGSQKEFQLRRTYSSGGVNEVRTITKPVAGTIAVYLNGSPQPVGWNVNTSSGIITFTSAPDNGVLVSADFQFDVPVRFDTDRLSARLDSYGVNSWNDIPLVEVRI